MELQSSASGTSGKYETCLSSDAWAVVCEMKLRSSPRREFREIWHTLVLRCVSRRTRDGAAELR
eukprot:5818577-Alexandrium_andersonii.AAC.1